MCQHLQHGGRTSVVAEEERERSQHVSVVVETCRLTDRLDRGRKVPHCHLNTAPDPALLVTIHFMPKTPLYQASTQFKNWRYSSDSLAKVRASLNAAAVAVIRNTFEADEVPLCSSNKSGFSQSISQDPRRQSPS